MLDRDLALLYGVTAGALNQAVKRNRSRFPTDFLFQLTWKEAEILRSQIVILSKDEPSTVSRKHGQHTKFRPFAFTEHGVAMLSSVLRSERAVKVNIEIMRAFVRHRHFLASHAELARKVDVLEKKYDGQFRIVFDALRQLMAPPPEVRKGRIGFRREQEGAS